MCRNCMSQCDQVVRELVATGENIASVLITVHELQVEVYGALLVGPGMPKVPINEDTVFFRRMGGQVVPFFATKAAAIAAMVSVVPELADIHE